MVAVGVVPVAVVVVPTVMVYDNFDELALGKPT
jgi:hypothetical protein